MQAYPLLVTLTHVIECKGFVARVVGTGRVLMSREDNEWWCNGVEPGGITGGGASPVVAFEAFKERFHKLLRDLADEAENCDEFTEKVETFFFDRDDEEESAWRTAVELIRGGARLDGFFEGLRRVADPRTQVVVQEVKTLLPAEENIVIPVPKVA